MSAAILVATALVLGQVQPAPPVLWSPESQSCACPCSCCSPAPAVIGWWHLWPPAEWPARPPFIILPAPRRLTP